jgi:hypothetical protein
LRVALSVSQVVQLCRPDYPERASSSLCVAMVIGRDCAPNQHRELGPVASSHSALGEYAYNCMTPSLTHADLDVQGIVEVERALAVPTETPDTW